MGLRNRTQQPFWRVTPTRSTDPSGLYQHGIECVGKRDGKGMIATGWALCQVTGLHQYQAGDFLTDGYRLWRESPGFDRGQAAAFLADLFGALCSLTPPSVPADIWSASPEAVMPASIYYGTRCWAGNELLEVATDQETKAQYEPLVFRSAVEAPHDFVPTRSIEFAKNYAARNGLPEPWVIVLPGQREMVPAGAQGGRTNGTAPADLTNYAPPPSGPTPLTNYAPPEVGPATLTNYTAPPSGPQQLHEYAPPQPPGPLNDEPAGGPPMPPLGDDDREQRERAERERAERERQERERAERERQEQERAERERQERERAEQQRQEQQRQEQQRLERERAEREEQQRAEQARIEYERQERERQERERAEQQRQEQERAEQQRQEQQRLERERIEREEQQRAEQARIEYERQERERQERERAEQQRQEQERARAEYERAERERAEHERQQREQAEFERQQRERAEQQRQEQERARAEQERLERERQAATTERPRPRPRPTPMAGSNGPRPVPSPAMPSPTSPSPTSPSPSPTMPSPTMSPVGSWQPPAPPQQAPQPQPQQQANPPQPQPAAAAPWAQPQQEVELDASQHTVEFVRPAFQPPAPQQFAPQQFAPQQFAPQPPAAQPAPQQPQPQPGASSAHHENAPSVPPRLADLRSNLVSWLSANYRDVRLESNGWITIPDIGPSVIQIETSIIQGGHLKAEVFAPLVLDVPLTADLFRYVGLEGGRFHFGVMTLDAGEDGTDDLALLQFSHSVLADTLQRDELLAVVWLVAATIVSRAPELQRRFGGVLYSEIGR